MSRYESASSPAENHLHTMKTFVSDYSSKVISMEETMADRVSLVWDSTNDPIGLLTEPFEAKKVQDLFSSGALYPWGFAVAHTAHCLRA